MNRTSEYVLRFRCANCGAREEVPTVHRHYAGSAADFCSACDEPRGDDDLEEVVPPTEPDDDLALALLDSWKGGW